MKRRVRACDARGYARRAVVRTALVLSDLHLGTGHRRGLLNIYDDFKEDDRLAQLLQRYGGGPTHLVLNGDIFDLLKVPVLGKFPDAISERLACIKLYKCLKGHPRVVKALGEFIAREGNELVYLPGNHDMELVFPGAQALFTRFLTGQDSHPRVRFVTQEPHFELDGVQFHHGHQFEAMHAFDWQRLTLPQPGREPVLNLPWGSLFILHVLNPLIRERPYLDKVHPFWPLFAGGMVFDTRFTTRMVGSSVKALVEARFNPTWWRKRPFAKLTQFLKNDVAFFERLDQYAERIFRSAPAVRAVFMGHTHVPMVRTFRIAGSVHTYVNTGTWIPMVDLGFGRLGQHLELHYGLVEWRDGLPHASLHRWHGQRGESEEVIA
jgi:UDP-2,3-diacylglucosamine pyrophosphatase LpxH